MLIRTNRFIAKIPCIVSVNDGCIPRMCIGKKFHKIKLFTEFPNIIKANARRIRLPLDSNQMPKAKAIKSKLEIVKRTTTNRLVGALIANNSLTVCSLKL